MNILRDFDTAITKKESAQGNFGVGYSIPGKEPYDVYMDNLSWKSFVAGMRPEHFNQYAAGDGNELAESKGNPPKMAAFASSSQMIYRHSRDIPGFVFEEQLPTTVGGTANLDGYLELPEKHIFVEAKCHEPYGHSSKQSISTKYKDLYEKLCGSQAAREATKLDCRITNVDDQKKKMQVEFLCDGNIVKCFDMKQMICHMLGIATKLLKHPDRKEIKFLYFLYNPGELSFQEKGDEIRAIFEQTKQTAETYAFDKIFAYIVDYLIEQMGLRASEETRKHLKSKFCFCFCDQYNYKDQLK